MRTHHVRSDTTLGTSRVLAATGCRRPGDLVEPAPGTALLVLAAAGTALHRIDEATGVALPFAALWSTPDAARSLLASGTGDVLVLRVPFEAVHEYGDPSTFDPPLPGALLDSVRAFLVEIGSGARFDAMSEYFLERLLWEMASSLIVHARGVVEQPKLATHLRDQAEAHIAAFRSDPALTPVSVARSLNVSLRQLQRAFAEIGTSPFNEIRRQRTEHAEALLVDPSFRPLGMEEIAHHAGFGDAAQMRRALHLLGRPTPRELRRAGRIGAVVAA